MATLNENNVEMDLDFGPQKPALTLPCVELWTDGACVPNPGKGAYAAILKYPDGRMKTMDGCVEGTTNNRMELLAIIVGLEALAKPHQVIIYSDSGMATGIINGTGMKPHKRAHQDLVQRLLKAKQSHRVSIQWVRGHSGVELNEMCDRLCTKHVGKHWADLKKDEKIACELKDVAYP